MKKRSQDTRVAPWVVFIFFFFSTPPLPTLFPLPTIWALTGLLLLGSGYLLSSTLCFLISHAFMHMNVSAEIWKGGAVQYHLRPRGRFGRVLVLVRKSGGGYPTRKERLHLIYISRRLGGSNVFSPTRRDCAHWDEPKKGTRSCGRGRFGWIVRVRRANGCIYIQGICYKRQLACVSYFLGILGWMGWDAN